MVKLGIIAFANTGGLAIQTKRIVTMLNPSKILVIDSSPFSKNKKQDFSFFKDYDYFVTKGFPKNYDIIKFIDGLTHVFTVENPYNFYLIHACRERGIKVICQTNYEFCENIFNPHLPVPDLFLIPSYWKVNEMKEKFGENRVKYLPPPIDENEFKEAREENQDTNGVPRFLHIIGTLAFHDRNGTLDLLRAVKKTKSDFRLIIRSQHQLPGKYLIKDKRVTYDIKDYKKNADLYRDFDALILPRRYGGLSLTTNEALLSGLPVMMTDISPNSQLLPKDWLVPAKKMGSLQARAMIDYYSADIDKLAEKIDSWCDFLPDKKQAYQLGILNFSMDILEPKYRKLFK